MNRKYAILYSEEDLSTLERAVTSATLPPDEFRKRTLNQIQYIRNRIEHGRSRENAMALREAGGAQPA